MGDFEAGYLYIFVAPIFHQSMKQWLSKSLGYQNLLSSTQLVCLFVFQSPSPRDWNTFMGTCLCCVAYAFAPQCVLYLSTHQRPPCQQSFLGCTRPHGWLSPRGSFVDGTINCWLNPTVVYCLGRAKPLGGMYGCIQICWCLSLELPTRWVGIDSTKKNVARDPHWLYRSIELIDHPSY